MVIGDGKETEECKMNDIEESEKKLQTEIQESRALLNEGACEDKSRSDLKEQIECKVMELAKLQAEMDQSELPRRSDRIPKPTEKMQSYQTEEINKREKRLLILYEDWKCHVKANRETLKANISESELASMADEVEQKMIAVLKTYDELRGKMTPTAELRRKVDACEAVTRDIVKVVLERLSAVSGEFDKDDTRRQLRSLAAHDYAHSVYGTVSLSGASQHSESSLAAKRADAAAELAAKEAEFKAKEEEIRQKEKIRLMQEQYKRDMEIQQSQLERLQAERDIEVARARLEVYNQEIKQEHTLPLNPKPHKITTVDTQANVLTHQNNLMAPSTDFALLAQAIQESISTQTAHSNSNCV